MRCRRLTTSTTDHRRLLGAPRAANRRIPPAWLPSDARRLGARARANTLHATRRWRACGRGVLSKKNPGDTGPRRQQEFHRRDHSLGSSHTANLKITGFAPQFSPYRSLWTMNDPKGPQISFVWSSSCGCPANIVGRVNFFWYVPLSNPSGTREVVLALSSVDCARRVAASADAHSFAARSATISSSLCGKNVSPF